MLFIGLLRRREPAAHKTYWHVQEGRLLQHRRGVLLHNRPCLHPKKRQTTLIDMFESDIRLHPEHAKSQPAGFRIGGGIKANFEFQGRLSLAPLVPERKPKLNPVL